MESHIKERLVGATVLVALGVWLIPWLLDGQDGPVGADAADDDGLRFELPVPVTRTAEPVEFDNSESSAQSSSAVAAAGSDSLPPPTAVASEIVSGSASPSEAEPEPEPAVGTRATADPVTSANGAAGNWVVQLGSYREASNASQVAGQVADYGYQASLSEFRSDAGVLHRVRILGFASREQAEAASSSLRAHGLAPQVLRED